MLKSIYTEFGGRIPARNVLRGLSKKTGIPQTKIKSFIIKINEDSKEDDQEQICKALCQCCQKYKEMQEVMCILESQLSSIEEHSIRLHDRAAGLERRYELLDQRVREQEQQRLGERMSLFFDQQSEFL